MGEIPISFQFKGQQFSGNFSAVHGGGTHVYHLMIGNYFYGRLRLVQGEWIFDTNDGSKGWESLADYFGSVVVTWHQ